MKKTILQLTLTILACVVSICQAAAVSISYTYDTLGRLTDIAYDNSAISYSYDNAGNILSVSTVAPADIYIQNETITTTRAYNAQNSITVGENVTVTMPTGPVNIEAGAEVTMQSKKIIFKPGFHAKAGSRLTVTAQ